MTTEKGYNGWTNYETWNYALWLGNEQSSSEYCAEMAQSCFDAAEADKTFTKEERATLDLAEQLKQGCEDNLEEWMPEQAGPFTDLLNAAVGEINWYEIAKHYIEEVEQTV